MDDQSGVGRVVAIGSGVFTGAVVVGLVGVYVYGLSKPEVRVVTARAQLAGVSPEAVWAVLGDPAKRPEWRPRVDRIAHIEDRDGLAVWRELDHDEDRFDFVVVQSVAPSRLVLAVAAPEQIGFEGSWTYELAPGPKGSTVVSVTEEGKIANPLWRGIHNLRSGAWDTVEGELTMLSTHLGAPATVERVGG